MNRDIQADTTEAETLEYLLVAEVAAILRLSIPQVYVMVNDGRIPHVRFGNSIRIPAAEFEAWRKTGN